jgi:hypothetical protein
MVTEDYSKAPKELLLALQLKQIDELLDTERYTTISYVVSFNDSLLRKDTLCYSMTSLNPMLNISLGGWPLR